jgi:hypothetical protein
MNDIFSDNTKRNVIVVFILLSLYPAYLAFNYFYYTLPPQQVSITVKYLPESPCRKDSPFHMQITNDSYRDVLGTSFTLSVKVDEQSDSIVQFAEDAYSTDTVVKAGTSHEGCWSYPKLYKNKHDPYKLIYEVKQPVIKFSS